MGKVGDFFKGQINTVKLLPDQRDKNRSILQLENKVLGNNNDPPTRKISLPLPYQNHTSLKIHTHFRGEEPSLHAGQEYLSLIIMQQDAAGKTIQSHILLNEYETVPGYKKESNCPGDLEAHLSSDSPVFQAKLTEKKQKLEKDGVNADNISNYNVLVDRNGSTQYSNYGVFDAGWDPRPYPRQCKP
jgi:hypothetical protein